jgi:hypothetical protein
MKIVVSNAFSLNMLALDDGPEVLDITSTTLDLVLEEIEEAGGFASIVGHADTAAILSEQLGMDVSCNRTTYLLEADTLLFVGQYKGPRLPEGTKTLPEGAKIEWVQVQMRACYS